MAVPKKDCDCMFVMTNPFEVQESTLIAGLSLRAVDRILERFNHAAKDAAESARRHKEGSGDLTQFGALSVASLSSEKPSRFPPPGC